MLDGVSNDSPLAACFHGDGDLLRLLADYTWMSWEAPIDVSPEPDVHTNDFAPIHRLRALKLGHASLATVFRHGRLILQPILRENLESRLLRYQPITIEGSHV